MTILAFPHPMRQLRKRRNSVSWHLYLDGLARVTELLRMTRRQSMDNASLIKHLQQPFAGGARPDILDNDEMLQPYLPDDGLLDALSCEAWENVSQGTRPSSYPAVGMR